jgi:D-alanine-D-alanine ligase-like ATP-grasp enzyme
MSVLKLKKKPSVFDRTQVAIKPLKKKVFTKFFPTILSRHPSHSILRKNLDLQPFRAIIRLGSTTTKEQAYAGRTVDLNRVVEINTVQAVKNSASKLLMKQCFTRAGVKTAEWYLKQGNQFYKQKNNGPIESFEYNELPYPIIAKSHYGSRGEGNTKLNNQQELETWMRGKTLSNYIFEKFYKYSREYRLHITNDGCFYTCRKLVRNDAPTDTWQRHDDVCVWILEDNASFKKPNNWNAIVQDCINAKNALGLDICGFDVMVQGSQEGRERTNTEWIICESCSAPSFGTVTGEKYKAEINKLLNQKRVNG